MITRSSPAGPPRAPSLKSSRRGRVTRRSGARSRLAYRVAATLVALALWQIAVISGVVPAAAVAAPTDIVRAAGSLVGTDGFGAALLDTMGSWAEGLLIAILIAIPAGLALGSSDLAYRLSRFTIDFLRTIPPVALIPLVLLVYGATAKMAFVLIVFGSTWPVLLQAMYGVHQVDPAGREVADAYRLRRRDRVRFLILPSAAPFDAQGPLATAPQSDGAQAPEVVHRRLQLSHDSDAAGLRHNGLDQCQRIADYAIHRPRNAGRLKNGLYMAAIGASGARQHPRMIAQLRQRHRSSLGQGMFLPNADAETVCEQRLLRQIGGQRIA